ncbi:MAG: HAMP domain-containing protein [Candidatus Aminicenantes bacterium]|nr:HAMP domain-containing protein [Candidatus Aminicenantes bacterium]
MKKLFPASFRARIILLYTIIFSLTLIIFGFYLYQDFGRRLNRNVEDLLLSRADGVVDSIENFWEKEKMDAAAKGIKLDEIHKLNETEFASMAQSWVNKRSKDPLLFNIVVTIFDRNGTEVASSKTLVRSIPLRKDILETVLKGQSRLDDLEVEMTPGRLTPFRALTFPAMIDNKVSYLVRVMTPLSSVHATMRELRLILFLILPLAIIFSGLSAWFLAGVTLRPVKDIISTARLIGAENLKTRIALPETHDEIRLLAETFNEMLDRLDRTFTSQREFIEDFSHEIKTPLAIIKGELEVTLKKIRSVKEYETTLHSSLEEIDRIIKVVDDLLTLARVEAEDLALSTDSVELAELVQELVAEMEVLAHQKNLQVIFEKTSNPQISGDREKLKRVFINLLDNAIKFTPSGGRIEVTVGVEANLAKVQVTDTGPGISPEQLPHIFDRFYRGSKDDSLPGSGLGLSIVKAIIEAHRGKIEVKSEPGQGSVFIVYLPLAHSNYS